MEILGTIIQALRALTIGWTHEGEALENAGSAYVKGNHSVPHQNTRKVLKTGFGCISETIQSEFHVVGFRTYLGDRVYWYVRKSVEPWYVSVH
ncbi:MAG: hypothetical protein NC930_06490 [Candidatus Omnitrophica bacterium]|nr:hypothetical protein [Candidatus Omnitrophota bacterium]